LHEDHHTFGEKHVVLGCIALHCTVVVACFVIQQLEIQQTKFVTTKECTFGAPFEHLVEC
jgi:hypothetical protein